MPSLEKNTEGVAELKHHAERVGHLTINRQALPTTRRTIRDQEVPKEWVSLKSVPPPTPARFRPLGPRMSDSPKIAF